MEEFEAKSLGGGASGAKIFKLGNKEYTIKYSDNAYKTDFICENISPNSIKNKKLINTNRKSVKNMKKKNNEIVFNSPLSYIRTIREIYLSKKLYEISKLKVNNIYSISNNESKNSNKEKMNNILQNYDKRKISNENKNKQIQNLINLKRKKLDKDISEVELTPTVIFMGFLKNCKFEQVNNKVHGQDKYINQLKITKLHQEDLENNLKKYKEKYFKNLVKNDNNNESNSIKEYKINKYLPFIISEFVKGSPLKKYVDNPTQNGEFKLNDQLRFSILINLGKTLIAFKEAVKSDTGKIIGCHRDMHPENIFININKETNEAEVKLIDFDLSITNSNKLSSNDRCTRNTLGKQNYAKRISGIGIKKTMLYLGPIYSVPFRYYGTPTFILKDDDLYQYYLYIKKFYFGMNNVEHKNNLYKILDNSIIYARQHEKNDNHYAEAYNKKIAFLKSFIADIEEYYNNNF